MSSDNAMRQKDYRDRKKEKMVLDLMKAKSIGRKKATKIIEDDIREQGRIQRQKNRIKNKGSVIIPKPKKSLSVEDDIEVDDDFNLFNRLTYTEQKLVDRMNNGRKTTASVRSLVQYIQKVKQVYKKRNKDEPFTGENIGLLKDIDKTMDILNTYKNPKDYIWSIINVLKSFNNTEKLVSDYSDLMGGFIKKNKREIKKNLKTQKQADNWLNYNEVVDMFKANKNKLNDNDRLLMSFIIYFPRRLQDYFKMRLHNSGSKNFNYNYLNYKRGIPTTFQFLRSKSQSYEDTTKRIPSSLKNIISNYIINKGVKNNELLFPKDDGSIHTADSFSKKIKNLFNVITGKDITMNLYRHIVATNLQDKGYSMNKREKKAQNMGHSLMRQMEYVKR